MLHYNLLFFLLWTNLLKSMSRSWVIEIPVWDILPSSTANNCESNPGGGGGGGIL